MVITNLKGGLGNQMFQYAAGKYLAHKHHTELKVDLSFLNADPHGAYTKRTYELDVFDTAIQIATPADVSSFLKIPRNRYTLAMQRRWTSLFKRIYFSEKGLSFHPQFDKLPKDTYLDGYWQSERYFKKISSLLRQDFTFKGVPPASCISWQNRMKSVESVSVHVRRGDYVSSISDNRFHGTCSASYYINAIAEILKQEQTIELFVFSDDLAWCKAHMNFHGHTVHFVQTDEGTANHWDLFLMSQCKHHVIANSSFSWWGAWLNANPSKIVIAPKEWFVDKTIVINDLIPPDWIQL